MATCALTPEFSILQDVLSRNEQQILMSPTPEELVQVALDLLINASKPQVFGCLCGKYGGLLGSCATFPGAHQMETTPYKIYTTSSVTTFNHVFPEYTSNKKWQL